MLSATYQSTLKDFGHENDNDDTIMLDRELES